MARRARRSGAVREYRRPRRIHHLQPRWDHRAAQALDLVQRHSPRPIGDFPEERIMAQTPVPEPHVERPGPAEFRDPLVRSEMRRAAIWIGMVLAVAGVIVLAQPLLLIIGGAIFAV